MGKLVASHVEMLRTPVYIVIKHSGLPSCPGLNDKINATAFTIVETMLLAMDCYSEQGLIKSSQCLILPSARPMQ